MLKTLSINFMKDKFTGKLEKDFFDYLIRTGLMREHTDSTMKWIDNLGAKMDDDVGQDKDIYNNTNVIRYGTMVR